MKLKKYKLINVLCLIFILLLLGSCQKEREVKNITTENLKEMKWEEILELSKGSSVNFYGWGGDEKINSWLDKEVTEKLKKKYNIKFKRIGMDISQILTRLMVDKDGKNQGSIDIIWINGENFYTAKNNKLLFSSFLNFLPNAKKYLNLDSKENFYDFGVPTEGMEAPWGRAQLVLFADSEKHNLPKNLEELENWIKNNPQKFTYPAPPDFTGSAFVRNIIMQFENGEKLNSKGLRDKEILEISEEGIEFLNRIKPNLWREGKTYPATFAQISNMYADNEIEMGMTYTVDGVKKSIKNGSYSKNTKIITLDKGGISNTHFLAVAKTSSNILGSLVVINELLSIDLQSSKADSNNWGDLSVLDKNKLSAEEKKKLEEGRLEGNSLPEAHASYIEILDKIWEKKVLENEEI